MQFLLFCTIFWTLARCASPLAPVLEKRTVYLVRYTSQPCIAVVPNRISPIFFQITPIDFANGTLSGDLSTWIGNDNTPANTESGKVRTNVPIPDPDVPTEFLGVTEVDSENNQASML